MRKKNALILADTRPALVGHVLLQIQAKSPGVFDEAIIYYLNMSDNDKAVLNAIMPCKFIKYEQKIPESIMELERFKTFSILMFVRYEMFQYLKEYETITWLDTDIIIQKSLRKMIRIANRTGMALIREDPINKTSSNTDHFRTCFNQDITDYDMNAYLYCSGTIVITRKLPQNDFYTQWCYEKTIAWANSLVLPDQGVLNAFIQYFNINVSLLKGKKYCCFPYYKRNCNYASIIHAWGANKFWNDWYLYCTFKKWKKYYEKWILLGGSELQIAFKPKISILIPVYKPNFDYFEECLNSLIEQKQNHGQRFSDFELIIIAEPFSGSKISRFLAKYNDPRIKLLVNKKRLGIAASLNKGMLYAKGDYIARMDDDDIAGEQRFFKQLTYLNENNNVILCTSDFQYFGDMNQTRVIFEKEMSRAWSIFTCPFDHPTIMFRKKFFVDNNLYYDETRSHVEDWELWLRAFDKGMSVGCIHEILFYHRWVNTNKQQMSGEGQSIKTIDMMRDLVKKNFKKLDIDISDDFLQYVAPWNGYIPDDMYMKLDFIFKEALLANEKLKLYDQESLEKVFKLRLQEAKTGNLPEISGYTEKMNFSDRSRVMLPRVIRNVIKPIVKPFYRPIKKRFIDPMLRIEQKISNFDEKLNELNNNINNLFKQTFEHMSNIEYQNSKQINDNINYLFKQMFEHVSDAGYLNAQFVNNSLYPRIMNIQKNIVPLINNIINVNYLKNRISLNENEKIRIVFLYQIPSFWPSWDTLWRSCIDDPRLDVHLVMYNIPIVEISQLKNSEEFLLKNKIPYTNYEHFDFIKFAPHIVVYQTPYDAGHRGPYLWAPKLKSMGIRVVYITYGIEISNTLQAQNDHFFGTVTQNAWRIYTFSEKMRSQYMQYIEPCVVKALGHPKFDVFFYKNKPVLDSEIIKRANKRKLFLWKIHFPKIDIHTNLLITPRLEEYLAFAQRLKNFDDFFFIFMAHPKYMQVSTQMEDGGKIAQSLLDEIASHENVYRFEDDDYRAPIIYADYIIVDRSAVMIEAGATGVPVMYMSNEDNNEPLTEAVIPLVESFYQGSTCEDMINFLEMCRTSKDPKRKERHSAFKKCIPMFDGRAGERIKEDMIQGIILENIC